VHHTCVILALGKHAMLYDLNSRIFIMRSACRHLLFLVNGLKDLLVCMTM
jgi:hypothetical protein